LSCEIRSVLTCESKRGVCRRATAAIWRPAHGGAREAVGIISAQSIGEPERSSPWYLPHRCAATRISEQSTQDAKSNDCPLQQCQHVRNNKNELIAMNRNGILIILDEKQRERERYRSFTARRSCAGWRARQGESDLLE